MTTEARGMEFVAELAAASAADLAATTNRVIEYERDEALRWARAYVRLYQALDAEPTLSRKAGHILDAQAHIFDMAASAVAAREATS